MLSMNYRGVTVVVVHVCRALSLSRQLYLPVRLSENRTQACTYMAGRRVDGRSVKKGGFSDDLSARQNSKPKPLESIKSIVVATCTPGTVVPSWTGGGNSVGEEKGENVKAITSAGKTVSPRKRQAIGSNSMCVCVCVYVKASVTVSTA